jgi:hypothetical protein
MATDHFDPKPFLTGSGEKNIPLSHWSGLVNAGAHLTVASQGINF